MAGASAHLIRELGDAASAHCSLCAVCLQAKLFTSLGLRLFFKMEIIIPVLKDRRIEMILENEEES